MLSSSDPPTSALILPYTASTDYMQANAPSSQQYAQPTIDRVQRHPDLWFSDGSVVLRAENTLFRVHMSQLIRRSVFFRDMFSLPQPVSSPTVLHADDGVEQIEGCPVVVLHDSSDDLASLLLAMYDGPFGNNDRDDFRVVSGILRLSTKYIIDSLREKAIAHLSQAWPLTLKGWDTREEHARTYELETTTHRGHFYPSPIAIIVLAREVNAPALLPSAFYDLSRYHYTQIFEPGPDEPLYCPPPAPPLSRADIQRLTLGKETSTHFVTSLIQSMPSGGVRDLPHPSPLANASHRRKLSGQMCVSAAACRKDFAELVDLATQHYLFDRERGSADPLYVAEELGQLKSAEFSECKACAQSLDRWATKERERIWKLLPSWFRLEAN